VTQLEAYAALSNGALEYILRDASAAAAAGFDPLAEAKYLDQINDATTILARRGRDVAQAKIDANKALFSRTWDYRVKRGDIEASDEARDFALGQMEYLGWPVPTATLLLDLFVLFTDIRRASYVAATHFAPETF
jgi:hypothetical protein